MEEKINPEKKQEYRLIRDNFNREKKEISGKIDKYKLSIQKTQKEISKLENSLKNLTPILEGCDKQMLCNPCGIYSMKHVYTQPGQGERIFHYECVICGHHGWNT